MISIAGIAAGGQAAYYTGGSASRDGGREDYYIDGSPGRWVGEGALALGLRGAVQGEHLGALFAGMSPATGQPLVQLQQHKEKNRQVAWDITLSDPKSVSAVYAVANASQRSVLDGIRAEVVQRVVLPYLQDITFSRRGKGGHTLEQADPVVAAFYHATSREMDPQTHVHLVVTNVGIRADGSTGTILSKPFYQHQGAMNALYLAELSHLLEERLGLRTEPQQSWFEVVGVPKSALDEWSKRKHEIDQAVADRGLSSAAARETAALSTRRAKKTMAREQLLTHWEAEGRRHGWTQKRLAARLGQVIVRNPYAVVQA